MDDPPIDGRWSIAFGTWLDACDERWEVVQELRVRGGRDVFDDAVACLRDPDPGRRAFGVDVLAQIGPWHPGGEGKPHTREERPYHAEVVPLLLELLVREQDVDVLVALGYGFGHLDDACAIAPLVALRGHADERVRHAIVHGLIGHDDDRAIAALIELSSDGADEVRDWATYGIGKGSERDTPGLRAALAARLDDDYDEVRVEAVQGLARCGDLRALVPLLALRETFEDFVLDEALWALAAQTGDPALRDEVEATARAAREEDPGAELPDDLQAALARYA